MKCNKCGAEIEDDALYCRECGCKVKTDEKLFCRDCGAELIKGSKFCSRCGAKVLSECDVEIEDTNITPSEEPAEIKESSSQSAENETVPAVIADHSSPDVDTLEDLTFVDKLKYKAIRIWNNMDLFSKIATIAAVIIGILTVIAICACKLTPIFISILQITALVVAVSAHKEKIELKESWMKYLVLAIAILLSVANISSYSMYSNNSDANQPIADQPAATQPALTEPETEPEAESEAESEDEQTAEIHPTEEPQEKEAETTQSEETSTTALLPISSADCLGKNYSTVVNQLEAAGFNNISVEERNDLDTDKADLNGSIIDITIDGNKEFIQGQEADKSVNIKITCHALKKCNATINIDFVSNLLFSRYDVEMKLDGEEQAVLKHGEDENLKVSICPGSHTITFEKVDSSDVNGTITIEVKGESVVGLKISCSHDDVDVKTVFVEDRGLLKEGQSMISGDISGLKGTNYSDIEKLFKSFGFTNITSKPVYDVSTGSTNIGLASEILVDGKSNFKRGDIFASDAPIIISYHEDEEKDPEKIAAAETLKALEKNFPKEKAIRAVVVAMTNCQASDVYESDGYTLDPNKFHSYSDIGDFFMTVERNGEWTALDENTWHVENIVLRIYNYDTYLKASGDIKTDGENYIFSNVDKSLSSKENINSTDPAKRSGVEHLEPSDTNSFLTVPASLISEARDESAAQEKMTAKEKRQKWINNQFGKGGQHTALTKLIKDNLNDSDSFKHVQTQYVDVYDEERQELVNQALKEYGFSSQVAVGDLFIMETFTAKNAFNATIKRTAYGIVRSSGTVILLGTK